MKVWGITFNGLWPVGASAVVVTLGEQDAATAAAMFEEEWRKKYPDHDPKPITVTLIQHPVTILTNGEY